MLRMMAALSLLLVAGPAQAIERRNTLYLHRLAAFERHMRAAIEESGLPMSVLDSPVQPDLRMFLDPRFRSSQAEFLYRKLTGRSDNAVLEVVRSLDRKVVVSFSFRLNSDDLRQRKAARQFVTLLRKRLKLQASDTLSTDTGQTQ